MKRVSGYVFKFFLVVVLGIPFSMLFYHSTALAAASLVTYAGPSGISPSNLYSVRAHVGTDPWTNIFTYKDARVMNYWNNLYGDPNWDTNNIAIFDIDGANPHNVSVEITKIGGNVTSIEVRPKTANIVTGLANNKGYFLVPADPVSCMVIINGDYRNPVSVQIGRPISAPSPTDPNVIYYGPGIHSSSVDNVDNLIVGDVLTIPAGKDVYLAGGAYLKARVQSSGANTKIYGRGIISGETIPILIPNNPAPSNTEQLEADAIFDDTVQMVLMRGNGSTIQGVTLMHEQTPFSARLYGDHSTARDVRVSGLNVLHLGGNDGIATGKYGLIDGVYEVVVDDAGYLGGNYTKTTNSFIAHAIAGGLEMGFGGKFQQIRNSEIFSVNGVNSPVGHTPIPLDATFTGGESVGELLVENSYFGSINSERWLDFYIDNYAGGYDIDPSLTGQLSKMIFRNVTIDGNFTQGPRIRGYDATYQINNITFDNVKVNGSYIHNTTEGNFNYVNGYYNNINFVVPSSAPGSFSLTGPLNGATSVPETTTFTWSASSNATGYELIISENSDLSNPVFDFPAVRTNSYKTQMDLDINKTYYWKVIASNGAGNVASSINSFTTNSTALKTGFVTDVYPVSQLFTVPTGYRYDGPNYVGYQFTPSSNITVNALGRPYMMHDLFGNHELAIWRVSDQTKIASVVLTPNSSEDTKNYRYEMLGSPVTLSSGVSYRIVSAENKGLTTGFLHQVTGGFYDTDPWKEYGVINHTSIGTIAGSTYNNSTNPIGQFPNVIDNTHANYGYVGIQIYTQP